MSLHIKSTIDRYIDTLLISTENIYFTSAKDVFPNSISRAPLPQTQIIYKTSVSHEYNGHLYEYICVECLCCN